LSPSGVEGRAGALGCGLEAPAPGGGVSAAHGEETLAAQGGRVVCLLLFGEGWGFGGLCFRVGHAVQGRACSWGRQAGEGKEGLREIGEGGLVFHGVFHQFIIKMTREGVSERL